MNIADLSKEQKQYVVIGGIVVVVLVALIVFVSSSLSSTKDARLELADLTGKIDNADRALAKRDQEKTEFSETSAKLKVHIKNFPPNRNYYSWATEIVYDTARLAGLEVDAINEQTSAKKSKKAGKGATKLESYSLRITARGGFGNIKDFLGQIEESQPLARVTGVDISAGSNPDIHDVQLFIQWPFNLSAIIEAWEAIAKKQEALGKHDSTKPEQPQPKTTKAAEPETPVPELEKPAPKKTPTPPPLRQVSETNAKLLVPKPAEPLSPVAVPEEPLEMETMPEEMPVDVAPAPFVPSEVAPDIPAEPSESILENQDNPVVPNSGIQPEESGKSANPSETSSEPSGPSLESLMEKFKE